MHCIAGGLSWLQRLCGWTGYPGQGSQLRLRQPWCTCTACSPPHLRMGVSGRHASCSTGTARRALGMLLLVLSSVKRRCCQSSLRFIRPSWASTRLLSTVVNREYNAAIYIEALLSFSYSGVSTPSLMYPSLVYISTSSNDASTCQYCAWKIS